MHMQIRATNYPYGRTYIVAMGSEQQLAQYIKQARLRKGLSRTETVSKLEKDQVKVSYGYLNKLELGDRSLASANIELREGLRHLYGISRSDWTAATGLYTPDPSIFNDEAHLESVDVNSGRRRIPVYDLVSTGPGSRGGVIVSHVDIPPEFVGEHSAYRTSGNSMIPDIKDGATVIVRVREYASAGNIIVCWTPEEGMLCKYLSRIDDGYFVLESLNSSYRPVWSREVRIYGIVVEIRNRPPVINGNH